MAKDKIKTNHVRDLSCHKAGHNTVISGLQSVTYKSMIARLKTKTRPIR